MSEAPEIEVPVDVRALVQRAGITPEMPHDEAFARLAGVGMSEDEAEKWALHFAQPKDLRPIPLG